MFLDGIFRRHLRPGAIFVDIGANMGYWSAVSASIIGTTGEVHAFEPVPAFFRSVERLRDNNPRYAIRANRMALGAEPGLLPMKVVRPSSDNFDNFDTNIGSSSILPGFLDHEASLTETIEVPITTFDDYAAETKLDLDRIGLIKLDVEGYESYCFDGMRSVLERKGRKVPILCEVLTDPARHEKLNGPKIVERLEAAGYRCLDATTLRPIDRRHMQFEENILCV
jgi:FkbM family methyltransferase